MLCSKFLGFKVTLGAICQGNTKKDLSDIFDTQFKEETLTNCKKFCNCQKDCKGFNFNPNSKKRKCSWKADSTIETFTNEGIQKSGQSCVIKGNKKLYLQFDVKTIFILFQSNILINSF